MYTYKNKNFTKEKVTGLRGLVVYVFKMIIVWTRIICF